MKKLLILAALVMAGAASGCRCCDWLWRGSSTPTCAPTAPVYSAPCYNPCEPCAGGVAPATVLPGPTG